MRVQAIWRHPVKSFQGEPVAEAIVDAEGLRGDRCWGVRDESTGRILTGRREPRLLHAAAAIAEDGDVELTLPGGETLRGLGHDTDAELSRWLGKSVTLVRSVGAPGARAEFFADATDDASRAIEWTMPPGRFVDAAPLLIVTTASLRAGAALHPGGAWELRRFRPNLLVEVEGEGWVEDAWCGRRLCVGDAAFVPKQPCVRCTMVTRAQPGLDRDIDLYKTLAQGHGGNFGVWTDVHTGGTVRVGDTVELLS